MKRIILIVLIIGAALDGICQDNAALKTRELEISVGTFSTRNSSSKVTVNPLISCSWDDYYIENRYNYEADNSASINAGRRILRKLNHVEIIPMVGLIFGSFKGVTAELQVSLDYTKWTFLTDNQFSYEYTEPDKSFYSNWSVARYKLSSALQIGFSGFFEWQANRWLVIDKGVTASVSLKKWNVRVYAFNFEKQKREYWLAVRYNFRVKLNSQ